MAILLIALVLLAIAWSWWRRNLGMIRRIPIPMEYERYLDLDLDEEHLRLLKQAQNNRLRYLLADLSADYDAVLKVAWLILLAEERQGEVASLGRERLRFVFRYYVLVLASFGPPSERWIGLVDSLWHRLEDRYHRAKADMNALSDGNMETLERAIIVEPSE